MTVSSTTNRVSYTGNGVTTAFAFSHPFQSQSDLKVILVTIADGTEAVQTITTHYTISGTTTNGVYASGGTVNMVTAPSSSYKLVIYRDPALTQTVDLVENDALPAETLEQGLDKAMLVAQRTRELTDRAVVLPDGFTGTFDTTLPTDINTADTALVVNSAGNGWDVGPTITDIADAATNATAAAASATLASQWASLTSGQVASTDYSSKAWAIGGTGVTDTASRGAAKEWAIETASTVDGTNYSAKEHAIGTQTRGASGGGSAKDWAVYTGGTVDDTDYSAKYHATQAAASAVAAAAAADSIIWNDVVFRTFADSPITLTSADNGKLIVVDCTSGAVSITLPAIAGLDLSNPFTLGVKKSDSSVNAITINRASTDTIDGATTSSISQPNSGRILIPDTDPSPDEWTTQFFGTADSFANGVSMSEISTPTTPSSGIAKVYPKTDNRFYQLNDGGIERRIANDLIFSGIQNLGISASVGSSALTINVVTAAGNTPTATDIVTVPFRNATSATGQYSLVDITSALSLTISSGSTLGQVSGQATYRYIYLINNSGTAELGISGILYDEGTIVSTTAEGGAGGADSANVLYTTTARSNVPVKLIGRILNTQTTAGTWAATPTEIALAPFRQGIASVAFVNFNGTGTVAIRKAFNVSSITDNGTGDYTINFTRSLPDNEYIIVGSAGNGNTATQVFCPNFDVAGPSGIAARIQTTAAAGNLDSKYIMAAVFLYGV